MSIFALKLLMLVIIKALLSLYNIDLSTIYKAQNAKVLCLFKKMTMAAASPVAGELVPDMINQ